MLAGFKRIVIAIMLTTIAGALMGALVGVMTENLLLWVGVMALVGAGFGVAMGYGFLPES